MPLIMPNDILSAEYIDSSPTSEINAAVFYLTISFHAVAYKGLTRGVFDEG